MVSIMRLGCWTLFLAFLIASPPLALRAAETHGVQPLTRYSPEQIAADLAASREGPVVAAIQDIQRSWAEAPAVRTAENRSLAAKLCKAALASSSRNTQDVAYDCMSILRDEDSTRALIAGARAAHRAGRWEERWDQRLMTAARANAGWSDDPLVNQLNEAEEAEDWRQRMAGVFLQAARQEQIPSPLLVSILGDGIASPSNDNYRIIQGALVDLAARNHPDVDRWIAIAQRSDFTVRLKVGVVHPLRLSASTARTWYDLYHSQTQTARLEQMLVGAVESGDLERSQFGVLLEYIGRNHVVRAVPVLRRLRNEYDLGAYSEPIDSLLREFGESR